MNKFIVMILALLVMGCATTLTEEESVAACPELGEECLIKALEQKILNEEYAAADRLAQHIEKYYMYKRSCTSDHFVFEKYPCTGSRKREQRKTGYCPPNHITEKFYCVNTRDFLLDLERSMRGY